MTPSEETNAQSPPISPFKRALSIFTSRGQLSPDLKQIALDGSALDTEEDESPSTSTSRPSSTPSPRPSSSPSPTKSASPSPRLGLVKRAVSLARRASSSGGVRKWQLSVKKARSFSVASAVPSTSRVETSLLFSQPHASPPHNDSTIEITIRSPSTTSLALPSEVLPPLSALNVLPLDFLPPPPSSMSHPSLPLVADEDNTHDIPLEQFTSTADVTVPDLLQRGISMTKVSGRKQKDGFFRLDPDQGQIILESKKYRISASLL